MVNGIIFILIYKPQITLSSPKKVVIYLLSTYKLMESVMFWPKVNPDSEKSENSKLKNTYSSCLHTPRGTPRLIINVLDYYTHPWILNLCASLVQNFPYYIPTSIFKFFFFLPKVLPGTKPRSSSYTIRSCSILQSLWCVHIVMPPFDGICNWDG